MVVFLIYVIPASPWGEGSVPTQFEGIVYIGATYQYIALISILVYSLFPAIFASKYFRKRGYEKTVIEFEFIKKLLLILIPVYSILSLVSIVITNGGIGPLVQVHLPLLRGDFLLLVASLLSLQQFSGFAVIGGLIRIITQTARKEFRFNFVKGWFILCQNEKMILTKQGT